MHAPSRPPPRPVAAANFEQRGNEVVGVLHLYRCFFAALSRVSRARRRSIARLDAWMAAAPAIPRAPESIAPTGPRRR
ncbi:MAG TPA: hypothetical protein VGI44_17305 [Acidimicrobiales bacterium]